MYCIVYYSFQFFLPCGTHTITHSLLLSAIYYFKENNCYYFGCKLCVSLLVVFQCVKWVWPIIFVLIYNFVFYEQTSAQREYNKNVRVFVSSMCIIQRKIVSNYCVKQCSNKYCLQNIVLFDVIYYPLG